MCICMIVITIISAVYDQKLTEAYGDIDQVSSVISNHTASYAVLVLLCVFIAFFALSW